MQHEECDEITGKEIDRYLQMVSPPNRPGRYQLLVFVLLCVIWTTSFLSGMTAIYNGYTPHHHCTVDNGTEIPQQFDELENAMTDSSCLMYANWTINGTGDGKSNQSAETVPCGNGWTYDRSQYAETYVTEYNLVCKDESYLENMMTVAAVIMAPATLLLSYLSDKFGRVKVLMVSFAFDRIVGFLFATLRNVTAVPILMGVATMAAGEFLPILIVYELFPAKHRGFVGIACEFVWVFAACSVPLMANYVRNWRTLSLIVTGISTGIGLIGFWFVPESPTWLLSKKRYAQAEQLLRKIAKFNGIQLPEKFIEDKAHRLLLRRHAEEHGDNNNDNKQNNHDDGHANDHSVDANPTRASTTVPNSLKISTKKAFFRFNKKSQKQHQDNSNVNHSQQQQEQEQEQQQEQQQEHTNDSKNEYGFRDLFRIRKMRIITIIVSALFLVNSLVYSGLFFVASYLGGNMHVNNILITAIELPSYMVTLYVVPRFGRKWPTIVFQVISGIGLIASVVEVTSFGREHTWIAIVTALIGKFGISGSYAVVYLYGPELFPTALRSTGFSVCRVSEIVAQVFLPYSSIHLVKVAPWLPRVIFGGLAILMAVPVLVLPETKDRPLPETIEEMETWR